MSQPSSSELSTARGDGVCTAQRLARRLARRLDAPSHRGIEMAKKAKRGRPVGSGEQLVEAKVLVSGPKELLDAASEAAEREGVSVREWWRRAARERLDAVRTRR